MSNDEALFEEDGEDENSINPHKNQEIIESKKRKINYYLIKYK